MKMRRRMTDLLPAMQQYIMRETKIKFCEDLYLTLFKVFRQLSDPRLASAFNRKTSTIFLE